jgi:flavin reductase (DIM6/NTAB) family NADH-FMN oxidoreductase RutF
MSKTFWEGGTILAPVPPVLVTCGTMEDYNVLTIGWTGIVNTHPPMTYISVRPSRHSYNMIKDTGRFVINLTTTSMCKEVDYCGVRSGKDIDKVEKCNFHLTKAKKIDTPIIEECPVALECVVKDTSELGTHTMFIAEIVGIDVDDRYIDSKGKLNLQQCGLMAYAHGEYFALGRKLGDFGFSVRRKKKRPKGKK